MIRLAVLGLFLLPTSAFAQMVHGPCVSDLGLPFGLATLTPGGMMAQLVNPCSNTAVPPPVTCSGTGLDFSAACNSQYVALGGVP